MTKACTLYYQQNLKQSQVADRLEISRSKVSRLLGAAKENGIIKIEIVSPDADYSLLESELEEKYDLKEILVIDRHDSCPLAEKKDQAGEKALEYLSRATEGQEYLGISAGTTLKHLADKARGFPNKNYKIVPIVGSLTDRGLSFNSNEVSSLLKANLGGESYLLNAPALVKDKNTAQVFKAEDRIKKIFSLYDKLDLLLVGIGPGDKDHPLFAEHLTPEELNSLDELKMEGNIGPFIYDDRGQIIPNPFADRIIGIKEQQFLQVPLRIGLAVGQDKREAILGAVRGKLINVLITDETVARWLKEA